MCLCLCKGLPGMMISKKQVDQIGVVLLVAVANLNTGGQQTSTVLTAVKFLREGSNLRIQNCLHTKHVYNLSIQVYTHVYNLRVYSIVCTLNTQAGRIKRTPPLLAARG